MCRQPFDLSFYYCNSSSLIILITLSIIREAQKGNSLAQSKIFECYGKILFRLAKRYVVDIQKTEDAVSEAFFTIFNKMATGQFVAIGPFEAWMKRIVVNECLNVLKKDKRILPLNEQTFEDLIVDDESIERLTAEDIFRLIEDLPTGYRTVFNLYEIEGFKHAEIADMLNISVGTSKSQLNKAKGLLQQKIILLDSDYAKRKTV